MTVLNGNHGRPTQVTSGTLLTTQFKHNGRGERVWVDNMGGSQLANFPDKMLLGTALRADMIRTTSF